MGYDIFPPLPGFELATVAVDPSLWPRLGTERIVSSIPGSVGYKSYAVFIKRPAITWLPSGFLTQFLCQVICTQRPEGTQVFVGSMNMGNISDTARNRTHNLFRPKREPMRLGHNDGSLGSYGLIQKIGFKK